MRFAKRMHELHFTVDRSACRNPFVLTRTLFISGKFPLQQVLVFCLAFGFSIVAFSAEPAWHYEKYAHYSRGEPLSELLQDFSSSIGVPVVVSKKVTAKVNGNFAQVGAKKFLNKLSQIYNFVWFYDGNVIFVSHADEVQTKIVHLPHLSGQALKKNLRDLGLWDNRFGFRLSASGDIAYLSGPPRFVQYAAQASELLNANFVQDSKRDFIVRVFPLRYALAADRRLHQNEKNAVIPGVASILRRMVTRLKDTSIKLESKEPGTQGNLAQRSLQSARGLGLPGLTPTQGSPQEAMHEAAPATGAPAASAAGMADNKKTSANGESYGTIHNAFIYAEPRLNAVIVRALKEDMPMFAKLIRTLDVPTKQVEIEVTILDISSDFIETLGFEWQANDSGSYAGTYSTILTKSVGEFILRIRALEEKGNVRIVSKPAVLTLDNEEAIIDSSETFYVKLEGERDVDLVPVTVGSVLKVTPRVVSEENENYIYLSIIIEDGKRENNSSVDNIPGTTKTMISSQAIVREQESLLLGGHYYEYSSEVRHKVPLLGDLPILGFFFSRNTTNKNRMTRMFMITPKIIKDKIPVPAMTTAQPGGQPLASVAAQGTSSVFQERSEMQEENTPARLQKNQESEEKRTADATAEKGKTKSTQFEPLYGWTVQAGSFRERFHAEKRLRLLANASFPAKLSVVSAKNGTRHYRVYAGNRLAHGQALRLRNTIRKEIVSDAFLVQH